MKKCPLYVAAAIAHHGVDIARGERPEWLNCLEEECQLWDLCGADTEKAAPVLAEQVRQVFGKATALGHST